MLLPTKSAYIMTYFNSEVGEKSVHIFIINTEKTVNRNEIITRILKKSILKKKIAATHRLFFSEES